MKFFSPVRLAVLLSIGAALALPAAADRPGQGNRHENGKKKERVQGPAPKQEARRQGSPPPAARPAPAARQSPNGQHEHGWQRHGGWQGSQDWHGGRAAHWGDEHRTWGDRGGYHGYYIQRRSYGLYFGNRHVFRIHERPVIYEGYPRFYHQGYYFILVDPYPETWEEDWYETDDVYIEYDNGYYLYNRNRPGYALAVTIMR
jgi:hypothetical protein